jgi:hypothetical protein
MTSRSRLVERGAPVLAALREGPGSVRYGYSRTQIFLARQGWTMSADRGFVSRGDVTLWLSPAGSP